MKSAREVIEASGHKPRNDGVECRTWTGLVATPYRRRRERVTLWEHPEVWPVGDCSRRAAICCGVVSGGTYCNDQHRKGLELAAPTYRVTGKGWRAGPWCLQDLPDEYLDLFDEPCVTQRYIHPHDKPHVRTGADGEWEATPPCECGTGEYRVRLAEIRRSMGLSDHE
jgi:hypothetical protein